MPINKIYHPAAVVSALVYYVWGWLWYTIFGSQWLDLINKTRADLNPSDPRPYIVSFAMAFVLAYATAIALSHDDDRTVQHGIQFGVFMGVALIASTMLTNTLFEGRSVTLWLINAGYPVTGLMIVGAIIGGWKKPSAKV
jgi:Protein of unknown function (DUF1761)